MCFSQRIMTSLADIKNTFYSFINLPLHYYSMLCPRFGKRNCRLFYGFLGLSACIYEFVYLWPHPKCARRFISQFLGCLALQSIWAKEYVRNKIISHAEHHIWRFHSWWCYIISYSCFLAAPFHANECIYFV